MGNTESPEHPGLILKERFLDPLGISPGELADSLGISRRRVSELLKARRRLSPEMAHRLGLYFIVPTRWFLEMQARFDAQEVHSNAELRGQIKPWDAKEGILITPEGAINLGPPRPKKIETLMVKVPDELLERLRKQAALSERQIARTPKIITLPDGTPILTGE